MGYQNLKCELVRNGIKQKEVAAYLGMTLSNFNKKLSEYVPFTVDEMKKIQSEFLPHSDMGYLCESDGDKPHTNREQCHAYASAIGDTLRDAAPDDPEVDGIEAMFHELAELAPDRQED